MSADSKMITVLKAEVAALKARVELLEETRSEPAAAVVKTKKTKKERDPDAPKKEPNSWIKFTSRVNDILKTNDVKLPGAEQKQFASSLKEKNADYDTWTEESILAERQSWVKPEVGKWAAAHPEGSTKTSRKNSTASSTKSAADAATEEVAEKPKKTRGRPKKTTEAEAAPAPVVVAPADNAESDDEDEEVIDDVELVTVGGKEYYKSEFNDLFDSDSMAYVGLLNGKKILDVPAAARVTEYLKKANM
uniref:Uncharacterized protein n=1 Tax=viral metagenome TaxID=1070528 RepID=A0A6C0D6U1_9ZZZZ